MSRRRCSAVDRPPMRTVPVSSPGYAWGMRPLVARISVLLPQPEGPATRSTSPASTVSDRSRSAGSVARR
jgi:hypothetical protein